MTELLALWTLPATYISLATLAALEIVLGIDNIVFISILASKLPEHQQSKARKWGLLFALVSRLVLLFSLSWLMKLTEPLLTLFAHALSGRDLILLIGGLFLVAKSTYEIHESVQADGHHDSGKTGTARNLMSLLFQIMLLDIVFSLDSVITAVGMVDHLSIMVAGMVIAVIVMILFADPVGKFVSTNPTMKMLALSFLILVGVMLIAESWGEHVNKGYIYFAMAFSLSVEVINMKVRKNSVTV